MNNPCIFSPCRNYRYTLEHVIDELVEKHRRLLAIMLNPSVAKEDQLDPTLRRVRGFSIRESCTIFSVGNIFAWADTDPAAMKKASDPVGPLNDQHLLNLARSADVILVGWGRHGDHLGRARQVCELLSAFPLFCLGVNSDGSPKHPLYVGADVPLIPYRWNLAL